MGKIKKYKNIVERFLSSEGGQRFFNAAYSLGAAVVILGAFNDKAMLAKEKSSIVSSKSSTVRNG